MICGTGISFHRELSLNRPAEQVDRRPQPSSFAISHSTYTGNTTSDTSVTVKSSGGCTGIQSNKHDKIHSICWIYIVQIRNCLSVIVPDVVANLNQKTKIVPFQRNYLRGN
ncbi:hypothetical protein AVEN_151839-1 [Araneus ventricosus]|uniref:Uncharacterized protein n=1 Tax=Araneus ventricosus TaxID=182803 RepID=A0A4Y2NAZ3_ARAVE|nr:hypothetical protein AVEN_151839-1 [Araneus ventricosus]